MEPVREPRGPEELARLRHEVSRLRGRLSLLSDLGARITSSLDLPSVLQAVVDAACQLTGAKYGALGVFDESGTLQQFVTHGLTDERRREIG